MRRIVSDTGPLITLEKLPDGYTFIRLLYDRIVVPAAVLRELAAGQFTDAEAYVSHYGIADMLEVSSTVKVLSGLEHLDAGEQEAISLAVQEELPLLIEEQAGRKAALEWGIRISGIAGQLVRAFRLGSVEPVEAIAKLRVLYEAGRINGRMYRGLSAVIEAEA